MLIFSFSLYSRSIYRLTSAKIPSIAIYNEEKKLCTTISDSHLEFYPQFAFTIDALKKYRMPSMISYLNNRSRFLTKQYFNTMIETFMKELRSHQKQFSYFTILKSTNFNFHQCCGLLILKCNHHPFIVKLFIERPETYFSPYCKGIESVAFFYMSGGANRHISGMSRLLNLDYVKKKLHTFDTWKHIITFPRKWLWLPEKERYMYLVGTHIGNKKIVTNKIPEVFALIMDEIPCTDTANITKAEKKKVIIDICNDFNSFLHAYYDNFIFKKSNNVPFTITIIDTEHFPTMVGFTKNYLPVIGNGTLT